MKKKFKNKIFELSSSNSIGNLEVRVYPAGFPYNSTAYCLHILNDEGFAVFHEGHVVNKKVIQTLNFTLHFEQNLFLQVILILIFKVSI